MVLDNELIKKALKKVKKERYIQGKMLEAVNDANYELATYLTEAYNETCSVTDELIDELILKNNKLDMEQLNDYIEDMAANIFGGNCSEGLSLSFLISNKVLKGVSKDGISTTDSYLEEVYYNIHTLATDRYLKAPQGVYKEEMLEHINNNICRSNTLRALFRGDTKTFEMYNPDLYFDVVDHQVIGGEMYNLTLLTSCMMLEEIFKSGASAFFKLGFDKAKVMEIIRSQEEMEKIASIYACCRDRNIPIGIQFDQFSDPVKEKIREGLELGEDYFKKYGKTKKKTNN